MRSIWIGWDPREASAFAVARSSLQRHLTQPIPVRGIVLSYLQEQKLYTRPTRTRINGEGRTEMVDILSVRQDYDGRISTQHANARFLTPHIARTGWALFMDGDMLVRGDVAGLFETFKNDYAAYCVKHDYQPANTVKMDGQEQTKYPRKNWSSFIAFNCDHSSNKKLTLEMVNTLPGRDLHALCWLDDREIGEIGLEWNWLVGKAAPVFDPKIVHFTEGVPDMPGYENVPFAEEWRMELERWAA